MSAGLSLASALPPPCATFDDLPGAIAASPGRGLVTSVNLVFGPPYQELQERQRRMFRRLGDVMAGIRGDLNPISL